MSAICSNEAGLFFFLFLFVVVVVVVLFFRRKIEGVVGSCGRA